MASERRRWIGVHVILRKRGGRPRGRARLRRSRVWSARLLLMEGGVGAAAAVGAGGGRAARASSSRIAPTEKCWNTLCNGNKMKEVP